MPDLAEQGLASVLDFRLRVVRVGGRQVHLVEHGHHLHAQVERGVAVGHGLRLHALAGVHHQQRAFAGTQAAADFVREVHVARGVDQVEVVGLAIACRVLQGRRLGLDGDAALALDVHRVEHLGLHLAVGQATTALNESVGQRAFAVVDVGNDREIADVIHASLGATPAVRRTKWRVVLPAPARQRHHWRSGAARAEPSLKKRHVQGADAPSNKTYGNCLLGRRL
jgi:hypothetical protein